MIWQGMKSRPILKPMRILSGEHAFGGSGTVQPESSRLGYHERKTVGEYYAQNRPEYRSWRDYFEPQKLMTAQALNGARMMCHQRLIPFFHLDDNGNAISPGEKIRGLQKLSK